MFTDFLHRLRALFHRRAVERELDDELRFHLEREVARHLRAGHDQPDAERRARLAFGGFDQVKEDYRDSLGVRLIGDVRRDVRMAARMIWKQPGFSAAAVLTLALGIGATTAIFSVVHGVLLKPLAFDEPERLVSLNHRMNNGEARNHGPDTYLTYREHQRVLEEIGAWDRKEVSITSPGEPERLEALAVTSTALTLLRVRPALGRLFDGTDDVPGSPYRVILTHGYWQRRFGGVPEVVGRPIQINGRSAVVLGVLPASFRFPLRHPALLLPLPLARTNGISFDFQVLGRLKSGVSLAAANADMGRMIPLLHPSFEKLELLPDVRPLVEYGTAAVADILWGLLAAVALVLLIACGNVANLFLVRAEMRRQELAMRAALGASAGRLVRLLLSESVLLGLAGGALGVGFAYAAVSLLRVTAPPDLPRLNEIGIDPAVLFFALSISTAAGVLFGLAPVLGLRRQSAAAVAAGGRVSGDAPDRHRLRNALAVVQVALAIVLMIVSGLMIRTVGLMLDVSPGFTRPEQVQTFRLAVPDDLVPTDQVFARTLEAITQRLSQVAGVESVGLSSSITMDGEDNGNSLQVEEFPVSEDQLSPLWRFKSFGPGYVETMGNRLVAGRSITWADVHARRPVILVSEPFTLRYWPEPSQALGKRVRYGPDLPWREIVGVVAAERDDGLNQPATAIVYWPLLNDSYQLRTMSCAVRSSRVGTPGFMRELQHAVWSVNPNLPLAAVQTVDEIRAASMARTSFVMVMLALAATVALGLSVVGIYAVIAYVAKRRTREIGVRVALGAGLGDVRWLFLRHGLRLAGAGIALGIVGAFAAGRVMSAQLFGVGTTDPITYAAVPAALGSLALLAIYLPARRAARVDPVVALKTDP